MENPDAERLKRKNLTLLFALLALVAALFFLTIIKVTSNGFAGGV